MRKWIDEMSEWESDETAHETDNKKNVKELFQTWKIIHTRLVLFKYHSP